MVVEKHRKLEEFATVQAFLRNLKVKLTSFETTKTTYLLVLSKFLGLIPKIKEGRLNPLKLLQDYILYLVDKNISNNFILLYYKEAEGMSVSKSKQANKNM